MALAAGKLGRPPVEKRLDPQDIGGLRDEAGEALRTIGGFIEEMNTHVDSIATSARSTGLSEVNQAVNAMDHAAECGNG